MPCAADPLRPPTHRGRGRRRAASVAVVVTALAGVGVAPAAARPGPATPAAAVTAAARATSVTTVPPPVPGEVVRTGGITRRVLAVTEPVNAAGEVMVLMRVRLAPGTTGSEHTHAGTQILWLESGVETVRVVAGAMTVTRADGTVETVTAPDTARLRAGDSWVEPPGVPHVAANPGRRPSVSLAALLVDVGTPLSIPVGAAAPGTPLDVSADFTVTENRLVTLPTPAGTRLFGTAVESATAVVAGGPAAGQTVQLRLAEHIDYTDGAGPWNGFLTVTFPDGSTLAAAVTGATIATADGGARFAGTLRVIGGTGTYASVTGGTGTYTGGRSGALGATPLPTRISLRTVTG